jgi:CheY-like chemotaxis protein
VFGIHNLALQERTGMVSLGLARGIEMQTEVRVVYIEDNFWNRKVVELLIVHLLEGAQFHIFNDSTDLLSRLESLEWKPNLILADIHMQPYNGYEVLAMLRQRSEYKNTKIIAITAGLTNEDSERLRRAGFDGVIAKPIDANKFASYIDHILEDGEVWNAG